MFLPQPPRLTLITTFGLGFIRPFPGTWGSLPPVILAAALIALGLSPAQGPGLYTLIMLVVILVFGYACLRDGSRAEARFLKKDPSPVVADETAGQALALISLPAAGLATPALTFFTLLLTFVAFRLFDILKPWPIWQVQRYPAGWGILLDDLLAGVYALAAVHLAAYLALMI